ncbi:MAG: ribonuclease III [Eubacteriales bacterium]
MNYREIEEKLNYSFKNTELLEMALKHSSYINERNLTNVMNYERLEFLGDAIFDAIISDYLFFNMQDSEEGELTKIRAEVVRESSLAKCGTKLQIGKYIYLSRGEENSGGRNRKSILADVMEAIIGAIYIDGGFSEAKKFVLHLFSEIIESAKSGALFSDFKTALQERLQANGEVEIIYIIDKETGPDHEKTFYINLKLNGEEIGKGFGKSKKEAEQAAAKDALNRLKVLN